VAPPRRHISTPVADETIDERIPELEWTPAQVAEWAISEGFPEFKEAIINNAVTGEHLLQLKAENMEQRLGMTTISATRASAFEKAIDSLYLDIEQRYGGTTEKEL